MKKVGAFFVSIYMWTALFTGVFWLLVFNVIRVIFRSRRRVFTKTKQNIKTLFTILFVKIEIEYDKDFDMEREYIIMPNHVSFFDVPAVGCTLPNFTFGIEAESHFSWPLYGFFIRKYGQLPINRKNIYSSLHTFEKAVEYMKETGASLLVFPEGHRSDDGKIQPLKKLPFKMAQMMKVSIAPVGLTGLSKLSPKGFFLTPNPIKVKYGKPIPYEEYADLKPEEVAAMVQKRIIDLCEEDIVRH